MAPAFPVKAGAAPRQSGSTSPVNPDETSFRWERYCHSNWDEDDGPLGYGYALMPFMGLGLVKTEALR